MAVYALGDLEPTIAEDAWVHPDAVVIGDVTLGKGVSIWPNAVLRGDYGRIVIGEMSNIQDGCIIHCTEHEPTIIGRHTVVGHGVHIEGSMIGDRCLISSGSIVLNSSVIGDGALVAAGALVSPRMVVEPRTMVMGMPARVREGYVVPEGFLGENTLKYHENSQRYRRELRRLDEYDRR